MKTRSFSYLLSLGLLLTPMAHAGDRNTDALATEAFDKGTRLYKEKDYRAAAQAFREANRLKYTWRLLFNIGQCEAAAKRHGAALDAFEQYLSEGGDDIVGDRQQYVLAEISRLRQMVGFLVVKSEAGDIVEVNDTVRATLPVAAGIRVAMGEARVRVLRGKEVVFDNTVNILGGEPLRLEVSDVSQTGAVASTPPPSDSVPPPEAGEPEPAVPEDDPAPPAEAPGKKKRLWTWVALGVGGAAGIAGAAVGGIALGKKNDFVSDCGENDCPDSKKDDRDTVNNLAVSADVLYGVAAVGIATGIVLFFFEPRFGSNGETAVTPALSENYAGFQFFRSF